MAKIFIRQAILLVSTVLISLSGVSQNGFVESIYFKSKSFSIDKKYEKALKHVIKQLASDSFSYLTILAFTDTNGLKKNNINLSQKRAETIYQYLFSRAKFDTTKVYITWLGESSDIYDLHFPEAHMQQNCVDIWVRFNRKSK